MLDVIERKARGEEVVVEEARAPEGRAADLADALERSLAAIRSISGRSRMTKDELVDALREAS